MQQQNLKIPLCADSDCRKPLREICYEVDRKDYCERCYKFLFNPKCNACGKVLGELCIIQLKKHWCIGCFRCDLCNAELCVNGYDGEYCEVEGKPYHQECHFIKRWELEVKAKIARQNE